MQTLMTSTIVTTFTRTTVLLRKDLHQEISHNSRTTPTQGFDQSSFPTTMKYTQFQVGMRRTFDKVGCVARTTKRQSTNALIHSTCCSRGEAPNDETTCVDGAWNTWHKPQSCSPKVEGNIHEKWSWTNKNISDSKASLTRNDWPPCTALPHTDVSWRPLPLAKWMPKKLLSKVKFPASYKPEGVDAIIWTR